MEVYTIIKKSGERIKESDSVPFWSRMMEPITTEGRKLNWKTMADPTIDLGTAWRNMSVITIVSSIRIYSYDEFLKSFNGSTEYKAFLYDWTCINEDINMEYARCGRGDMSLCDFLYSELEHRTRMLWSRNKAGLVAKYGIKEEDMMCDGKGTIVFNLPKGGHIHIAPTFAKMGKSGTWHYFDAEWHKIMPAGNGYNISLRFTNNSIMPPISVFYDSLSIPALLGDIRPSESIVLSLKCMRAPFLEVEYIQKAEMERRKMELEMREDEEKYSTDLYIGW